MQERRQGRPLARRGPRAAAEERVVVDEEREVPGLAREVQQAPEARPELRAPPGDDVRAAVGEEQRALPRVARLEGREAVGQHDVEELLRRTQERARRGVHGRGVDVREERQGQRLAPAHGPGAQHDVAQLAPQVRRRPVRADAVARVRDADLWARFCSRGEQRGDDGVHLSRCNPGEQRGDDGAHFS